MNRLRHSYRSKVTVTLIRKYDVIGAAALNTRCDCGRSSVRSFYHIARKIIVRHNGTAYGCNAYCLTLNIKLIHNLCYEAVDYAVRATGAIMKGRIG